MYNNMVDKVWNGLSVRWSFYMKSEDGSVIVVKSEPHFTPEFDSVEIDDGKIFIYTFRGGSRISS